MSSSLIITQEFYKGILKLVEPSQLDYFMQRGINPELLYNLFFSEVVIGFHYHGSTGIAYDEVTLKNYPGNDEDISRFQKFIEWMVDQGVTTASEPSDSKLYGPPLTADDLVGSDFVARAAAAGLQVNGLGWCELTPEEQALLLRRKELHILIKEPKYLKAACDTITKPNPLDDKTTTEGKEITATSVLVDYNIPPVIYRMEKDDPKQDVRFCIDPSRIHSSPGNAASESGDSELFCNPEAGSPSGGKQPSAKSPARNVNPLAISGMFFKNAPTIKATGDRNSNATSKLARLDNASKLCDFLSKIAAKTAKGNDLHCDKPDWDYGVSLTFMPRSVYGMIYYLGEVVRRENYPDTLAGAAPTPYASKPGAAKNHSDTLAGVRPALRTLSVRPQWVTKTTNEFSCSGLKGQLTEEECGAIFHLEAVRKAEPGFLRVDYDGWNFVVPDPWNPYDARTSGNTYEVMDIVTELLALNRSAKDLPTSSVFTLRGAP